MADLLTNDIDILIRAAFEHGVLYVEANREWDSTEVLEQEELVEDCKEKVLQHFKDRGELSLLDNCSNNS